MIERVRLREATLSEGSGQQNLKYQDVRLREATLSEGSGQ